MSAQHAKWLREAAEQIAKAGHNGWGNTCLDAAASIEALVADLAAERALREKAEAEAAGLRADAERYRELRRLATAWPQTVLVVNINIGHDWRTADAPEEIDSVVDAAIDAARGGDK